MKPAWIIAVIALAWAGGSAASEVKVSRYGVTKDGVVVRAYTLVNDAGASAVILDHGARIAAINVPDRDGKLANTVMAFKDMAGWESLDHANAIIGRVANRVTRGFTLDGVRYDLKAPPNGVVMHGAPDVWTARMWTVDPVRRSDGAKITLHLDSPAMDQGYPGGVKVTATYRWTNDNALRLDMEAVTDAPTPVNLTNHVYFNLTGNSTTPVWDHEMQVLTDRKSVTTPQTGPTGEIMKIAGTPYDFQRPTPIKERLTMALGPEYANPQTSPPTPPGMLRRFDESYVLADGPYRLDRVAARLHDKVSGRIMELRTTEPTVHVFTPNVVPFSPTGGPAPPGVFLTDVGKPFTRTPAIALETQHLPDSVNHPEFPSTILRPGEVKRTTTVFQFLTDKSPPASSNQGRN
jgi:aldose 1-epimerase